MTDVQSCPRNEVDIDHHTPYWRDNLPQVFADLHATGCPVAWSPHWNGYWLIYGFDAIHDAVHDTDTFSSAPPKGVPESNTPDPYLPIDYDPPYTQEYRRIMLSWFSPGAALALEGDIRELATELIDEFIEAGTADLSQQLFTPLPARLIMRMLGFDESTWEDWVHGIHSIVHDRTSAPEKTEAAIGKIAGQIGAEIAKRREELTDDLMSDIMRGGPAGTKLDDGQLFGAAFLQVIAGMDTTAGLTGNAAVQLASFPELRRDLLDHPDLIDDAVEEFLRHDSPSMGLYRRVTRDITFHGQEMKAGDSVILLFPGASRDPAKFDDPDTIDFRRTENRHVAFGLGPHRCLGSNHARLMAKVMLEEVLRRLPDYELDGKPERFADGGDVWAVRYLPVRFTPGVREGS